MLKYIRQVGTFTARDSEGSLMALAVLQEFPDAGTMPNPQAELPGAKYIMTMDGRRVDKIGARKYRVMGGVLTSDDPAAP
jgi:hypothetical protein